MDFLTEEDLELLEPAPDIHALFVHYNQLYFESKLGACSVEWSSARMTWCGGTCELIGGGAGGARIKLSQPLLKLRPTRDLKEVLLHEMTHAYMMLQGIRDDDRGGHGTIFKSIIQRINNSQLPDHQRPPGGYNVAVYHTMYAEVDHYRQHHWQCEQCGNLVKRAMNRPPQEADCRGRMGRGADCRDPDCRFHMHQKHCGGVWAKIKEPEGYQQKGKKRGGSSANNSSSVSGSNAGGSRGSTEGGSNASCPDGAHLPAKRPKKGGGGRRASAAAGTRPITDFFGGRRSGAQQGADAAAAAAGAAAATAAAGGGASGVLPALLAVRGAAPAAAETEDRQQQQQQAQQQQQQQQSVERPEPSADERRRLLAEAAVRRLAGAAGRGGQLGSASQQQQDRRQGQSQQQHQHQQPEPGGQGGQTLPIQPPLQPPEPGGQGGQTLPTQQPPQHQAPPQQTPPQQAQRAGQQEAVSQGPQEVIDLLDSPPEAAPGKQRWAGAAPRQQAEGQRMAGAGQLERAADGWAADGGGSVSGRGKGGCLECPVCGRQWGAAAVSNAELNAHIDECLNASFL